MIMLKPYGGQWRCWVRTDTRFRHPISADGSAPAAQVVRYWGHSGRAFLRCKCPINRSCRERFLEAIFPMGIIASLKNCSKVPTMLRWKGTGTVIDVGNLVATPSEIMARFAGLPREPISADERQSELECWRAHYRRFCARSKQPYQTLMLQRLALSATHAMCNRYRPTGATPQRKRT